jgi:hypothetical protein
MRGTCHRHTRLRLCRDSCDKGHPSLTAGAKAESERNVGRITL